MTLDVDIERDLTIVVGIPTGVVPRVEPIANTLGRTRRSLVRVRITLRVIVLVRFDLVSFQQLMSSRLGDRLEGFFLGGEPDRLEVIGELLTG